MTTMVRVFDASALVALFNGHPEAFRLVQRADSGDQTVLFPAAAIAEAGARLRARPSAWEVLQLGPSAFTSLTAEIAVDVSDWPGDVATRHALWEALAVRGRLVTAEPDRYASWTGPITKL
jgi:predicted nucleic acid-binding protein